MRKLSTCKLLLFGFLSLYVIDGVFLSLKHEFAEGEGSLPVDSVESPDAKEQILAHASDNCNKKSKSRGGISDERTGKPDSMLAIEQPTPLASSSSPETAVNDIWEEVSAWHYSRMLEVGSFVSHTGELVETSEGPVLGQTDQLNRYRKFMGIPYAMPPVGINRWQRPKPLNGRPFETLYDKPDDSKTVYDARGPGRHCVQMAIPALTSGFISDQLSCLYAALEHEDCLNLNIYTPFPSPPKQPSTQATHLLPVIVFIYGGAFVNGSPNMRVYNPVNLVKSEQVIIVSPNYRLGVLGFLGSHQLQADAREKDTDSTFAQGAFGNYGVLDIIVALQWVKRNIAAFGGNPERITLMGHSAGASIVSHLVVAAGIHSALRDLFHKTIIMSGALETFPDRYLTESPEDPSQNLFDIMAKANGCATNAAAHTDRAKEEDLLSVVDCLRNVPAGRLLPEALHKDWGLSFQILIDRHLFTRSPVELVNEGAFLNIPTLVTICENDGSIFFPRNGVNSRTEFLSTMQSLFKDPTAEQVRIIDDFYSLPLDDQSQFDWNEFLYNMLTDGVFTCPAYSFLTALSKHNKDQLYTHTFSHTFLIVWLAQMLGLVPKLSVFHGAELIALFASIPLLVSGNCGAVRDVRRRIMSFVQAEAKEQYAQHFAPFSAEPAAATQINSKFSPELLDAKCNALLTSRSQKQMAIHKSQHDD